MIAELYEALKADTVSPEMAKMAAEAVEKYIDSREEKANNKIHLEKIVPLEKDNIGIRAEIKMLAETMKAGFENAEKQRQMIERNLNAQIQSLDKRIDLLTKLFWLVTAVMISGFGTVITILMKYMVQ